MAFDSHPTVYWLMGIGWMLLNVAVVVAPTFKAQRWLSVSFGFILLVWMRLPLLVFNQELNPDESQVIGHALTLATDPVFWRSVDGTTIGPLDIYPLTFLGWLGFDFDYTTARLFGLLCVVGSLLSFRAALRNFFGERVAQVGWLPPLFLLSFTQEIDLVHYSSEQVPLLLLNLALWQLSRMQMLVAKFEGVSPTLNPSLGRIFNTPLQRGEGMGVRLTPPSSPKLGWQSFLGLGILLGMMPYAKLQGVPQAAVLGLWGLMLAYQKGDFIKNALLLVGGALICTFFVIAGVLTGGLWTAFVDFYLKGNLIYAGGSNASIFQQLALLFGQSRDLKIFLLALVLLAITGIWVRTKTWKTQFSWLTFWSALYLMAGIYAATKSGNVFLHYLNFCLYPLTLLSVCFWPQKTLKTNALLVGACLVALPFLGVWTYKFFTHQPLNQWVSTPDHRVPLSGVSLLIRQHAQAGEKLVVWGWMGRYHVETQMPQGAAESHFERCIYPHPMRQRYYQRFLADMRRNRPKVFVDAVGPNSLWLNDRPTQAHENFPELAQIIRNQYTFVGEVEHTRVYVRNQKHL